MMQHDQANNGSLGGALQGMMRQVLMGIEDMLPARVVAYDDATNRATIQPLIMMGTSDGGKVSRAAVPGIPVFRFGGGGFFVAVPIAPGDFGWLKACDRDISLMMQRGGLEDWPNTERLHSFSDAMFFPDTLKDWVIDAANAAAMVIQSLDGTVCISVHAGKVVIDAPRVEIAAPDIAMTGDVQITGDVAISGGSLTHNGTDVGSTHKHGGVQSGSSNTGVPV